MKDEGCAERDEGGGMKDGERRKKRIGPDFILQNSSVILVRAGAGGHKLLLYSA
jgi:hypothetical protein